VNDAAAVATYRHWVHNMKTLMSFTNLQVRNGDISQRCLMTTDAWPQATSTVFLSTFANADGPRDAASRKIDHIALPTEYNYQSTSVGR